MELLRYIAHINYDFYHQILSGEDEESEDEDDNEDDDKDSVEMD